jgi:hypothetical protein
MKDMLKGLVFIFVALALLGCAVVVIRAGFSFTTWLIIILAIVGAVNLWLAEQKPIYRWTDRYELNKGILGDDV